MGTSGPVDPGFMGYMIQGALTSERFCLFPQTFTTTGTIAACCPKATTLLCNYRTECLSPCVQSGYSCVMQTIYDTSPTINAHTHFVCVTSGWDWSTLFRYIPASTSATVIMTEATPPPASAAATTTPGSSISQTASATTSTSSPTSSSPASTGSKSHAGLIAGITIGVLAALAILVVGLFFLRKRQRKWKAQHQIAELEASSPSREFKPGNQQSDAQFGSSTTVVPGVTGVHPALAEYYAKQHQHLANSSGAAFGSLPVTAFPRGPGGEAFPLHNYAQHHSSGSAVVSPIGPFSSGSEVGHISDGIFSPVPLSELDAVESAIPVEMPTNKDSDNAFMSSPALSSDGNRIGRGETTNKDYDGDGDSENSEGPLTARSRKR